MHVPTPRRFESGFSLVEILVVVAVLALIGAGAVALIVTNTRQASYVATVDRLQSFVSLRRQEAATKNRVVDFSARTELVEEEGIVIAPRGIDGPPGYTVASAIRFEAGTGRPLDEAGQPRATAILVQSGPGTGAGLGAVAVSTSGVVTVWHHTNGNWSN